MVETESGVILSIPVRRDDPFALVFIHSVHRTPVFEHFLIRDVGVIQLVATEYETYGVGMPSLPSEGVFEQQGSRFRLSQLNRRFSEIPLRVGPEAQLTLLRKGMEYPISKWLPAGALVKLHVDGNRLWVFFQFIGKDFLK